MKEGLEVLENQSWWPVVTRARTREGMKMVYRRMCDDKLVCGMRIVTVHEVHLGKLNNKSPASKPKSESKCPSCGKPFTKHAGLTTTCKRLDAAKGALRVIRAWAMWDSKVFKVTRGTLEPEKILNLIDKVLHE